MSTHRVSGSISRALVLLVLATVSSIGRAACQQVLDRISAAERNDDLAAMYAAFEAALQTDCVVGDGRRLSDAAGPVIGRMQLDAIDRSTPITAARRGEVIRALQRVAPYNMPWDGYELLADLLQQEQRYEEAALQYQAALRVVANVDLTPDAVEPARIDTLFKKGEQARLLAQSYVPSSVSRNNEQDGFGAASFRGFKPRERALPIEFVTDSVQFTAKGQQYLQDLARQLRQLPAGSTVRLIGHTDRHGTDAHNDSLSGRRAEAVAQALRSMGIALAYRTEGRGEREPRRVINADTFNYTSTQVDQMNRRVEWVRPE